MKSLFRLADYFVPNAAQDPLAIQRHRAAVLQSWVGVFFTLTFGALYTLMGSPWSGGAILLITVGLLFTPPAIRRGYSRVQIGNGLIAATWLATFVVASRSGGFSSPSLVWSFLLPLCTYSACNQRSAVVWTVLSGVQVGAFYLAYLCGVQFAQDFSPGLLATLRISGYLGVIIAIVTVLLVVESVRTAAAESLAQANRAVERERILADMHDGLGSQLLGLVVQARARSLDASRLLQDLENCLDDLRLIVGSGDVHGQSVSVCLAELRARMTPRCCAAGIELAWSVEVSNQPAWASSVTLQVLRCAQEMLSNAIRHSGSTRVWLSVRSSELNPDTIELEVRDNGIGPETTLAPHGGRGLRNLHSRAQRLGGHFHLLPSMPGARALLTFPRPKAE